MNPKKNASEKAVNAGISLAPSLKKRITRVAKRHGMRLSAYASRIFTDICKREATDESANQK